MKKLEFKRFERIRTFFDSSWSWAGVVVGGISLGLFFAWLPYPRATVQLIMVCVFVPVILGLIWLGWNGLRSPLDEGWDDDYDEPSVPWMNQELDRQPGARP